jgi:thiol-disulfide isomerase/thioredoxin
MVSTKIPNPYVLWKYCIFLFVFSISKTQGQTNDSSCYTIKLSLTNGNTVTYPLCLTNKNVLEDTSTAFGVYQIYEKGDIKAFDIELPAGSKSLLFEFQDSLANVLSIVAFDKNSGNVHTSQNIRAPLLFDKNSNRGLNTMAALYAGTFKNITGIKAIRELQQIYLDSFYNSLNLQSQNFSVLIDYYVFRKDSAMLSALISEAIQKGNLADYELQYASIFARRILNDDKLIIILDSLRNIYHTNTKPNWQQVFYNAQISGKSEDFIEALHMYQASNPINEKEKLKEIPIRIEISKALSREKKTISEILKWVPENFSIYQYWNNYIPIVTTAAKIGKKDDLEIFNWLKKQQGAISLEKASLNAKPVYLLKHQYIANLDILLEEIAVANSILNAQKPFKLTDLTYQKDLLIKFPSNETIQVSFITISNYFYGYQYTLKELNSIVPPGLISKNLSDSLDTTTMTSFLKKTDAYTKIVGKNISNLEFEDTKGNKIKLENFKDSLIVLDLWATWCLPCIQAIPSLIKIKQYFNSEKVKFLMLNYFENRRQSDVIDFITKKGLLPESLIFDAKNQSFDSFGITSIPTTIIVDRKGVVIEVIQGFDLNYTDAFEKSLSDIIKKNNSK